MDIKTEDVVTWVGFLLTWLIGFFGFGRAYGALSARVSRHDQEISDIQKEFKTSEGEQRLVSHSECDKFQNTCQRRIDERHERLVKRIDTHDTKLDQILEGLAELKTYYKSHV